MFLVSKCLTGAACRWDGGTNLVPEIKALEDAGLAIAVCPEVLGGLPTPRRPSEVLNDKVIDSVGTDVTASFRKGAYETLCICLEHRCELAILKSGSPSCGCGHIHNGKFDGGMVVGNGITASLLMNHGIKVVTEQQWLEEYHVKHL